MLCSEKKCLWSIHYPHQLLPYQIPRAFLMYNDIATLALSPLREISYFSKWVLAEHSSLFQMSNQLRQASLRVRWFNTNIDKVVCYTKSKDKSAVQFDTLMRDQAAVRKMDSVSVDLLLIPFISVTDHKLQMSRLSFTDQLCFHFAPLDLRSRRGDHS